MTRIVLAAMVCLLVAACGGGNKSNRVARAYGGAAGVSYATGPISTACLQAGRKAANSRLCGCVQAEANRALSSKDQALAATFFADPHRAQEVRQSDNGGHEAFWKRYKAFAARAERTCQGL